MNNSDSLTQKIKQQLDEQKLPEEIQRDLAKARRQALNIDVNQRRPLLSRYVFPTVAFASVCAIAIAITLVINPIDETNGFEDIETFEIITSRDDIEMYENLEFYLWLEDEMKSSSS